MGRFSGKINSLIIIDQEKKNTRSFFCLFVQSDDLNCDPALVWANWQLSFPFESILRTFKYYTFFQQISQDDQICLFRHGEFK